MYNFGLSATQRKTYEALLQSSHRIEIHITIMDLDHNEKTSVSTRLMDGQVTVDADADVTRSLDLDLLDPSGALHLDSKSPDDGAMFADRMIRVSYTAADPTNQSRYTCPIFTGPITRLERDGAAVHVEAQGKELLGNNNTPWISKTYKKGHNVVGAIKSILTEVIGENKYDLPDVSKNLPRNVSVGVVLDKDGNDIGDGKTPWQVAKDLASSIGYQLYYDGLGVAAMRKKQTAPVFSFRQGPGGCIKSNPSIGFNIDNVVNCVEVFGKKPEKVTGKTTKKQPHFKIVAPKAHPLSPWSLGRSGGPRYMPKVINDDSVTTDAEAKSRATDELNHGLVSSLEISYDSLVIPHLEELDVVKLIAEKFSDTQLVRKFSVPLTARGSMTVGYVKNVKTSTSVLKKVQRARRKAAKR